jgi:hypothetical protein
MTFTVIDKLTGQEADQIKIIRNESWASHLRTRDIDGWALMDYGTLVLIDNLNRIAYPPEGRFEIVWDTSESITGAAVTLGECQAEWMADPD